MLRRNGTRLVVQGVDPRTIASRQFFGMFYRWSRIGCLGSRNFTISRGSGPANGASTEHRSVFKRPQNEEGWRAAGSGDEQKLRSSMWREGTAEPPPRAPRDNISEPPPRFSIQREHTSDAKLAELATRAFSAATRGPQGRGKVHKAFERGPMIKKSMAQQWSKVHRWSGRSEQRRARLDEYRYRKTTPEGKDKEVAPKAKTHRQMKHEKMRAKTLVNAERKARMFTPQTFEEHIKELGMFSPLTLEESRRRDREVEQENWEKEMQMAEEDTRRTRRVAKRLESQSWSSMQSQRDKLAHEARVKEEAHNAALEEADAEEKSNDNADSAEITLPENLRGIMRGMPASVVVITTSAIPDPESHQPDRAYFRGMTLSSFTTVSLEPRPIIQFNVKAPSRTLEALMTRRHFFIHTLQANDMGAQIARHFTKGNAPEHRAFDTLGKLPFYIDTVRHKLDPDQFREVVETPNSDVAYYHLRGLPSGRSPARKPPNIYIPKLVSPGILSTIECKVLGRGERSSRGDGFIEIGDHYVVLAKVIAVSQKPDDHTDEGDSKSMPTALAYAHGSFASVGPRELQPTKPDNENAERTLVTPEEPTLVNPIKLQPEGSTENEEAAPPLRFVRQKGLSLRQMKEMAEKYDFRAERFRQTIDEVIEKREMETNAQLFSEPQSQGPQIFKHISTKGYSIDDVIEGKALGAERPIPPRIYDQVLKRYPDATYDERRAAAVVIAAEELAAREAQIARLRGDPQERVVNGATLVGDSEKEIVRYSSPPRLSEPTKQDDTISGEAQIPKLRPHYDDDAESILTNRERKEAKRQRKTAIAREITLLTRRLKGQVRVGVLKSLVKKEKKDFREGEKRIKLARMAEQARKNQKLAAEQARNNQKLAAEWGRKNQKLATKRARKNQKLAAEQARKNRGNQK